MAARRLASEAWRHHRDAHVNWRHFDADDDCRLFDRRWFRGLFLSDDDRRRRFGGSDRRRSLGCRGALGIRNRGSGLRLLRRLLFPGNLGGNEFAAPLHHLAQSLAQLGVLAELFGKDVSGAQECVGYRGNVFVRIGKILAREHRARRLPLAR